MDEAEQNATGAIPAAEAALRGQAIYTRSVLAIYDVWVHGISNPLIWGCRTGLLQRLYARHLSANHMDVGIGTGYFLARCSFPSPAPRLLLVDANDTCSPSPREGSSTTGRGCTAATSLSRSSTPGPIDSIALMYVLHCLPGDLTEKARVFDHLNVCLTATGVIFGATILGQGVASRPIARRLMAAYNARGIFFNASDDPDTLRSVLVARYREVEMEIKGSVALFSVRSPS